MNRINRSGFGVALLLALGGPAGAAIEITDGWSRQTPPGVTVAVGYFTLRNTGAEARKLLKIVSPIASSVDLHQSTVDANGMAKMLPVGSLSVPAGGSVKFAPGGKHLMLSGLTKPVVAGTRVPVTLTFEDEEPVTVQLVVQPLGAAEPLDAGAMSHEHPHHP